MAYRMELDDDTVQDSVRRIAVEQLSRAIDDIDDRDLDFAVTVHQVRKRCKKLRGLLRLVRPAFDTYSAENKAFRDAARLLSGTRDKRTLINTYDAVTSHFEDEIDRRDFGQIRGRLTRDAQKESEDPATEERMQDFRREMEAARERAAKWKLEHKGRDVIEPGVAETYKRARKRMQEAWSTRSDEAMHEWRKRVKDHWYHARLLGSTVPDMMGPHADAAERLSNLLGDHHDLAVLDARLRESPDDFGTATDLDAFRALIEQRKDALAQKAFALGRQLLAEQSKALGKRWGVYWKVWAAGEAGPDLLVVTA